ncbi:dynein light chain roadblock-type 2 [Moniliophthora roreri MCA 2997]|uniref:Dynein light chain roadblock-type 2 n=2 Tax=Moniliophthora roreri TaxID=221103 RepID=V2XRS6_MONRO|nr:dynein light chain roadblock-type 2 [Moniliophthora roreri MCA 2997]KAI3616249.1 dynein light chain roadblock-type 2 [Moniliophthora roreri]
MSLSTAPARTSTVSQPNAASSSSAASVQGMSPELEQTLTLLSSHRSVLGYMLLSRGHPVSIIRHSGVVFEGEKGKKYASAIGKIVESVQSGLEEIHGGESDGDDVKFLRIRTKRHEIMISPDGKYLLAVLHDPSS